MKRFLLFAGYDYYPNGGFKDFKGSFDSTEDAFSFLSPDNFAPFDWWYHVVDTQTGNMVDINVNVEKTV